MSRGANSAFLTDILSVYITSSDVINLIFQYYDWWYLPDPELRLYINQQCLKFSYQYSYLKSLSNRVRPQIILKAIVGAYMDIENAVRYFTVSNRTELNDMKDNARDDFDRWTTSLPVTYRKPYNALANSRKLKLNETGAIRKVAGLIVTLDKVCDMLIYLWGAERDRVHRNRNSLYPGHCALPESIKKCRRVISTGLIKSLMGMTDMGLVQLSRLITEAS